MSCDERIKNNFFIAFLEQTRKKKVRREKQKNKTKTNMKTQNL